MRYHWLKENQNKNLVVYWEPGANNYADYFTKHHSPVHHKRMCTKYILKGFHLFVDKIQKSLGTFPNLVCEGVLLPYQVHNNDKYVEPNSQFHTSMGTVPKMTVWI